jgi:hypothetical protein
MRFLIELFFGEWECVVMHLVPNKANWLIVCHKHSVTGRVKGYVDMGSRPFYQLEHSVVKSHIQEYGK